MVVSDLKINVPCDQQCWVQQGVASQHCALSALRGAELCSESNQLLSQSNAQDFRHLIYQSERGKVAFQEMPGFRGRSCSSRTCLLREIVTGLKHTYHQSRGLKNARVYFLLIQNPSKPQLFCSLEYPGCPTKFFLTFRGSFQDLPLCPLPLPLSRPRQEAVLLPGTHLHWGQECCSIPRQQSGSSPGQSSFCLHYFNNYLSEQLSRRTGLPTGYHSGCGFSAVPCEGWLLAIRRSPGTLK